MSITLQLILVSLRVIAIPGPDILIIVSTSLTADRGPGPQTILDTSLTMLIQLACAGRLPTNRPNASKMG